MNRAGSDRTGPPEGETARKSAGPDWGSWAWLGLGWACEKKRIGPRPVSQRAAGIGGQRRRRRCGWRFSPLDAAMKAGMGAGDGSGHRQHSAVVDLGLTGV
ncbi:hypothetical protein CDL15_Pgr001692 [Punica granatum]|uniref:Uncharacterized protein n=1 Tax=Punica granatum TaxID=22663 RepID=A0A218XBF1_PUNGR|nr:hypothetical protein CDL15_Pgr001692 [Punica granatum]PKI41236.1 hypothetical protein CRG98_038348 [Punica granatum]